MNRPAGEGTARRRDSWARELAQREFRRPVVLEAGAGTGKTTTLVARLLAWLLGPGWEQAVERAEGEPASDRVVAEQVVRGVVAVTFTEAAAAEMAGKAVQRLAALADPEASLPVWLDPGGLPQPEERARRARALLGVSDQLTVRTLHAWCLGLLAEYPLEAGLHPDLRVDADGTALAEVAREVLESRLQEAYGRDAEVTGPYLRLAARGIGPEELAAALIQLGEAALPEELLDPPPLGEEAAAALAGRLRSACGRLAALATGPAPPTRAKGRRVVAAAERLRSSALPLPALFAEAREAFDTCRDRLREWSRDDFKAAEAGWIAGPGRAAAATELLALVELARRLDPELLALAHAALAPLYRQLRGELRRRGIATFQDLLAATARLFREHPEVLAQVRRATDQLLVDEVQDTDPLQYEILGRLALEGPAEERPGLFLVGDPKQSIYGWRSADLAAYQRFVARVGETGEPPQPLQVNFRSVPAVLAEVTRVLEPVMLPRDGLQPGFQRLLPDEERAAAPGFATAAPGLARRAVEHWISWPAGDGGALRPDAGAGETTELEAEWIAEDVGTLHDRHGVPWREVALLLRVLGDQDVYLDALRRRGIPFAVGRNNQYYRRREVIEAAALVRAVLDPGDHVALLTVLRSSMVGVPDAALVPLWRRRLPDALTTLDGPDPERLAALAAAVREAAAETPPGVPGLGRVAGWEEGLLAAADNLARARRAFRDEPADDFVDTLRRLFLPEPLEAARYLGVYRLANLERFFRRLVAALDDEPGDAAALLRALRRSVAEAQEVSEGQPQEGVEDAVRVMTIHSAKGLEFGHVYLPQVHRQAGAPPERHPTRARVAPGGEDAELLLLGQPTPGWLALADEDARVEAAERVRLLYVAATRARDRLVVVGRWPDRPGAGDPDAARSFADLLPHRAGRPADLAALAAQARDGDGAVLDDDGVLWRFPALTRWPERTAARERPAHLPEPAAVRREAALLADLRVAAAAHQARPHSAAASEEAHHRLREQGRAVELDAGRADVAAETRQERVAGRQDVAAETRPRRDAGAQDLSAETSAAPPVRGARVAGGGAAGGGALDREVAMAVGTAIHRALEALDPAVEPEDELARLDALLPAWVDEALGQAAAGRTGALAEARRLLAGLAGGRLLARLREIAPEIVARELPVLLPPPLGVPEGPGIPAPVGFVAGAIDLLYRDPATGELVVADHKTDAVDEADLAARAEIYRPQGAIYARAVREALALPRPPRVELWFLRADRVVVLGDASATARPAAVREDLDLAPPAGRGTTPAGALQGSTPPANAPSDPSRTQHVLPENATPENATPEDAMPENDAPPEDATTGRPSPPATAADDRVSESPADPAPHQMTLFE